MTHMSKKFLKNSSIHGLRYLQSEYPIFHRILWVMVIIVSLFGAWLLASGLWFRFMASPTRLSLISTYTPIDTIPFPALTICPLNKMRLPNIKKFLKSLTYLPDNITQNDIIRAMPQIASLALTSIVYNLEDLAMLQDVIDNNRYTVEDIQKLLGQSCKDLLLRCLWEGKIVTCSDYFENSFTTVGSCCSFNYKSHRRKNFTQKYSEYYGPYLGMSIVFDVMRHDSLSFQRNDAILVVVHNSLQYPILHENVVFAVRGYETFIGVKATREFSSEDLSSLPDESRECVLPHERNLKYFPFYGESNCQVECYMNLTIKYCDCVPLFYPKRLHEKTCNLLDVPCIESLEIIRLINDTDIECDCMYLCNTVYYTISTNKIHLRRGAVEHSLSALYAGINTSIPYGVVHMYYSKQVSVLSRQDILTSWTNLISNLGGVFGLFLGFSFMSVAEFVYFIWLKIKSILWHGNTKRRCKSPKIKHFNN